MDSNETGLLAVIAKGLRDLRQEFRTLAKLPGPEGPVGATGAPGIAGTDGAPGQADWGQMWADEMRARNPVPESVTRAQGKAALITAGLWPGALDFVAAILDPTERTLAEVALDDTQQWHRSSPFFNAAADALGLTGEQRDNLFLAAAKIEL